MYLFIKDKLAKSLYIDHLYHILIIFMESSTICIETIGYNVSNYRSFSCIIIFYVLSGFGDFYFSFTV